MADGKPLVFDRWDLTAKIIFTLFFAAIGVALYYIPFGSVGLALVVVPIIALGWAASNWLVLLPSEHRYFLTRGLWPFAKRRSGTFDDIEKLRISIGETNYGKGNVVRFYELEVIFAVSHCRPVRLCTGNRKEIIESAAQIVASTGLRIVETREAAAEDPSGSVVDAIEERRSLGKVPT